jgi:hypothetical protein
MRQGFFTFFAGQAKTQAAQTRANGTQQTNREKTQEGFKYDHDDIDEGVFDLFEEGLRHTLKARN